VACGEVGLQIFSPSLELVQTLDGHDGSVSSITVSPSGSHIASGGWDKKVMIWSEPGEGGEWARVQVLQDHTGVVFAVCFSPDGKQLATGSRDRLFKTYSFNEGNAILAHTLEGHTYSRRVPLVLPTANSFAREVGINPSNFGTLPMEAW